MKVAPVSAPTPVLDSRLLGRPIHLLGNFTSLLRDEFAEYFRLKVNRRYRAEVEVGEVVFEQGMGAQAGARWHGFANEVGCIGFAASRAFLLCMLEYRYGAAAPGAAAPIALGAPESASEERLATLLGQQFVVRAAGCLARLPGFETRPPATDLRETRSALSAKHDWVVRVEVVETRRGVAGTLHLGFDDAWMQLVLQGVAPMREQRRSALPAASLANLDLPLRARLLEKELPLGSVLDIRVGDVLPIRLEPAAVFVGGGLLFRAMVAEHGGKLCLTSFEDVD